MSPIELQANLDRIDREWEAERQQHLVRNWRGRLCVPRLSFAKFLITLVGLAFGITWTALGIQWVQAGPDEGLEAVLRMLIAMLGNLWSALAVGYTMLWNAREQKYQRAYVAYLHRRQQANLEQPPEREAKQTPLSAPLPLDPFA